MNRFLLIFCLAFFVISKTATAQQANPLTLAKDRQFDFWVGEWDVNLRIQQPDKTWLNQVKSKAEIYSINGGRAILELWNDSRIQGIKGFSLRYYDWKREKWVLWLNWPSPNASGMSSLEGEFRHGRGEFFGGKGDTLTRYSFSDISPYHLRWDDAFTKDGGKTWTHNWIMEFTRTAAEPAWPEGEEGHTYDQGSRCNLPGFDVFRGLVGNWKGEAEKKSGDSWQKGSATLKGFGVLQGCAVLNFTTEQYGQEKTEAFSIKTFNTYAQKLSDGRIGDQDEDTMRRYFGSVGEGKSYVMTEFDQQGEQTIIRKYDWDMRESDKIKLAVYEAPKSDNPVWVKVKQMELVKQ